MQSVPFVTIKRTVQLLYEQAECTDSCPWKLVGKIGGRKRCARAVIGCDGDRKYNRFPGSWRLSMMFLDRRSSRDDTPLSGTSQQIVKSE